MPFSFPHPQASRQTMLVLLMLCLLAVAALAAVTLAAPGASHHTLMSPTGCRGTNCSNPGMYPR